MGAIGQEMMSKFGGKDGFMADIWTLIKTYGTPEESDEYWKNLVDECDRIWKKHDDELVENILLAFVNYLEYKSKCFSRGDISLKVLNNFRRARGLNPVGEVTVKC